MSVNPADILSLCCPTKGELFNGAWFYCNEPRVRLIFTLLKGNEELRRESRREERREGKRAEDLSPRLTIYVGETKRIWSRPFNLMLSLLC